jgi:hypothetical protein
LIHAGEGVSMQRAENCRWSLQTRCGSLEAQLTGYVIG